MATWAQFDPSFDRSSGIVMLIHISPGRSLCCVTLWQSDDAHLHSPDFYTQLGSTYKVFLEFRPSHANHPPLGGGEVDIRTLEFGLGTGTRTLSINIDRLLLAFSLVLNMLAAAEMLGLFVSLEAAC
jgi:hypothetical protein